MQFEDLPYAHLLERHTGPLRADGRYDTVHFDDLELTGGLHGARFLECAFTGVRIEGAKLRLAGFNEVWIQGSRLVGADLAETEWQDAEVDSSVLAGIAAYGSAIRRTVFRQCKLEAVNFRGAVLRDVVFEDCLLRDVDFGEAKLTAVSFPGSTLDEVRLAGATLKSTDLRGATRLHLPDAHQGLRGATISTHQLLDLAPQFAHALGITVKDA
ncbi:pentapeptide repeat-containing protein [Kitasatospora sp. NPDC049285]|uniref:pentapeptide repeat-containing protein n=1 Tax=Kitasatospora sp. NPDC049285 TaxID=3157096 RepID=UPI003447973A